MFLGSVPQDAFDQGLCLTVFGGWIAHPWRGPGVMDKPTVLLPLSWGLGLEWLADETELDRSFHEVVQACSNFLNSGSMQEGVVHVHEE